LKVIEGTFLVTVMKPRNKAEGTIAVIPEEDFRVILQQIRHSKWGDGA
jgi:hypothetical protein